MDDVFDESRLVAASFIAEALGLEGKPAELAADLVEIGSAPLLATYAVELDSSRGRVALLIWLYDLDRVDDANVNGRQQRDRDLEMLEAAVRLGAPGPRLIASGEVGRWGAVLATTPGDHARLGGQAVASAANLSNTPMATDDRARLAGELLVALRRSVYLAETYLAASEQSAERTSEEAELGLFLTDPRSLEPLLGLVRRTIVEAAAGR